MKEVKKHFTTNLYFYISSIFTAHWSDIFQDNTTANPKYILFMRRSLQTVIDQIDKQLKKIQTKTITFPVAT